VNLLHFFKVDNIEYAYDSSSSFVFQLNSLSKEILKRGIQFLMDSNKLMDILSPKYEYQRALNAIEHFKLLYI
jgi:hypothetical protein